MDPENNPNKPQKSKSRAIAEVWLIALVFGIVVIVVSNTMAINSSLDMVAFQILPLSIIFFLYLLFAMVYTMFILTRK
jgi:uncharacterized integral membrane protein